MKRLALDVAARGALAAMARRSHDAVEILAAARSRRDEPGSKRMRSEVFLRQAGHLCPVANAIEHRFGRQSVPELLTATELSEDGTFDDPGRREPNVEGAHRTVPGRIAV